MFVMRLAVGVDRPRLFGEDSDCEEDMPTTLLSSLSTTLLLSSLSVVVDDVVVVVVVDVFVVVVVVDDDVHIHLLLKEVNRTVSDWA